MEIEYRKILPSESKLYRVVRLESLQTNPERFFTKYEDEKHKETLAFEGFINENIFDKFVIGAFQNNQLIGISSFYKLPKEPSKGVIVQMFVKPKFRKNNIGFNLVKKVVETAFELKGISQIVLDVLAIEEDLLKDFYLKTGFKIYNEKTVKINDESFDFIQMRMNKAIK